MSFTSGMYYSTIVDTAENAFVGKTSREFAYDLLSEATILVGFSAIYWFGTYIQRKRNMSSPTPTYNPKMRVLLIISILVFLGCLAFTGTYAVMAYSGALTTGVLSTLLLKMFASGFIGLVLNLMGWAGRRDPDSKKVWILGFLIISLVVADSILLLLTSSLYV